jgi:hypothetical protein
VRSKANPLLEYIRKNTEMQDLALRANKAGMPPSLEAPDQSAVD